MEAIKIIDYTPEYRTAFRTLNQEWIEKYFKMEEADFKSLDFPEENIINKGGYILVAVQGETAVGVCALIKMEDEKYDYELAKMGVSPKFQGQGIGYLLGKAVIEKAISLKSRNIYLESNKILTPAINLYKKLGFKEVFGNESPYERSNIQMELLL